MNSICSAGGLLTLAAMAAMPIAIRIQRFSNPENTLPDINLIVAASETKLSFSQGGNFLSWPVYLGLIAFTFLLLIPYIYKRNVPLKIQLRHLLIGAESGLIIGLLAGCVGELSRVHNDLVLEFYGIIILPSVLLMSAVSATGAAWQYWEENRPIAYWARLLCLAVSFLAASGLTLNFYIGFSASFFLSGIATLLFAAILVIIFLPLMLIKKNTLRH